MTNGFGVLQSTTHKIRVADTVPERRGMQD